MKIRVEATLRPLFDKWGIQQASYEHRHVISGARKDALYGHVILEYKKPGELDSKTKYEGFKEKLKKQIMDEAEKPENYGKWLGILIDGQKIAFIRYRKNDWDEPEKSLPINAQTVMKLLESIRGLRRKPIDAEFLLQDFGPKSEISKKFILTLYDSLVDKNSPRTDMLFNDWKRVFSQVCSYSKEKLAGLIEYYGLTEHKKLDSEKLLYSVHTYYTILMKLLTSEIVTLYADSLLGSYLKRLEEAYCKSHKEMLQELKDLEEGGIFATVGIRNFLEADYFAWYLDEWNEKTAALTFELVKKLLDYEPATVELNPERVKDLFKRLYQNLVPRDIRHSLGEYFTPDWLAELLLNETEYDGNPDKRVLDPACGSGTFLVLTIKRIREYESEHTLDRRELLEKIINNVKGIDLNPLAVLASKANYIIALSDLLRYRSKEGIEIPVYLADSISVKNQITVTGAKEYELDTSVGSFKIREELITKDLWEPLLTTIDESLKIGMNENLFERSILAKKMASKDTIGTVVKLYAKLLDLERQNKNRIWTKVLKNSAAPLLIGRFDYVIGNPPWINWESLPETYRNYTRTLWDRYGLLKTEGVGMGKASRDLSMLFVARCFNQFVNKDGKLAFLIPFTTFKTQAGAGFRKWLYYKCQVMKIHDLVELYPFEGATNRTSLIVIKEGQTKFPISSIMWSNPRTKGIGMETDLKEVYKTTKQFTMILSPIKENSSESPWMITTQKAKKVVEKILGRSPYYKAYKGVYSSANGIFWINILSKQPNGLLIRNTDVAGLKKKVKETKAVIQPDLIYPLIRGRDIKRWHSETYSNYMIVPTQNGETIPISDMKIKYQKEYNYFHSFFKDLISVGGEPYKSRFEPYRKMPFDRACRIAPPFYWLFNVSPSLAEYKVVWKRIAGGITGKAVGFASAVVEPVNDKYLEKHKPVILCDSLILIPFQRSDEAYYVCGILNSTPFLFTIASYTYELRMETHITQYLKIPEFDSKNKIHIKISELSKKAHELAKKHYEQNELAVQGTLTKIEKEIDENVAKLYMINQEELDEIMQTLKILKGE